MLSSCDDKSSAFFYFKKSYELSISDGEKFLFFIKKLNLMKF